MVITDSYLDYALDQFSFRRTVVCPQMFKSFMTFEKFPAIELPNACEELLHSLFFVHLSAQLAQHNDRRVARQFIQFRFCQSVDVFDVEQSGEVDNFRSGKNHNVRNDFAGVTPD